jgi:hypothetical protein
MKSSSVVDTRQCLSKWVGRYRVHGDGGSPVARAATSPRPAGPSGGGGDRTAAPDLQVVGLADPLELAEQGHAVSVAAGLLAAGRVGRFSSSARDLPLPVSPASPTSRAATPSAACFMESSSPGPRRFAGQPFCPALSTGTTGTILSGNWSKAG